MSDIEKEKFRKIGIGLINEYRQQRGIRLLDWLVIDTPEESAFIRSIQLHENTKKELQDVKQELADFRQEVSDAVKAYNNCDSEWESEALWPTFESFIIPSPKTDPLVEVMKQLGWYNEKSTADFRAALDAAGFEIREKNDGL